MDFMEFRAWIGLWTAFILVLCVVFNLSFLVKYITRFTEDCFASLVAVIFIIDAIKSTIELGDVNPFLLINSTAAIQTSALPPNTTYDPMNSSLVSTILGDQQPGKPLLRASKEKENTAFNSRLEYDLYVAESKSVYYFSVILFLLTFTICLGLRSFRNQPFLPSRVNTLLKE
jgi:hypothetical protein